MSSVCCWWNKSIGSKFSVVLVVLQKVHLKWRIDFFCIFLTKHPSSCKYSAAIAVLKNYLLKQTDFLSNWCFAHFFEKRSQFQAISGVEPAVSTSFCSNSAISRQFYVFCTFLTKNSNFKQTTQLRRLFLTILTENGISMFSAYFWQTKAIKANLQLDALSCLRLSLNRALSVRFLENNFISSKVTVVHAI